MNASSRPQPNAWQRRWLLDAPGVKTGFYIWGKRAGDKRAHAYRVGTRTVEGMCGFHFGPRVTVPDLEDEQCPACAARCDAMARELFGKSLRDKVIVSDPNGRYATQGPYGPLERMGRRSLRLHPKSARGQS